MAAAQATGRSHGTFLDWGVAVPFTTPALAHARARPSRAGRVDLVAPNPSGGKGVYVLELGAVGGLFVLTVHDRLLIERLLELPAITPEAIRAAARRLSAGGAAGRWALRAAEAAEAEEATDRLLLEFHLVNQLLRLAGLERLDWLLLREGDDAFRRHLRGKLNAVAPRLGCRAEDILRTFAEIGRAAGRVGPGDGDRPGRDAGQIARLSGLAVGLRAWAGDAVDATADLAGEIARCAERTLAEARSAHAAARALLEDVLGLLAAWRSDAAAVRDRFARTDWLLDGWEEVCGIWEDVAAEPRALQRDAVERIGSLLPLLDRKAKSAAVAADKDRFSGRNRVRLHEDWQTGEIVGEPAWASAP